MAAVAAGKHRADFAAAVIVFSGVPQEAVLLRGAEVAQRSARLPYPVAAGDLPSPPLALVEHELGHFCDVARRETTAAAAVEIAVAQAAVIVVELERLR